MSFLFFFQGVALNPAKAGPGVTITNGLRANFGSPAWQTVMAGLSRPAANTTGYYFEATATTISYFARVGFCDATADVSGTHELGNAAGGQAEASDFYPFSEGDVLGFYLKNNSYWRRKNGVWTGNPVAGTGGIAITIGADVFPAFAGLQPSGQWDANFGASPFDGAIPSGGLAWNGQAGSVMSKYLGAQSRAARYLGTRADAVLNLGSRALGWV